MLTTLNALPKAPGLAVDNTKRPDPFMPTLPHTGEIKQSSNTALIVIGH